MKKFVLATVATVAMVGVVLGEDLTVQIQKVDVKAGTITYVPFGKGGFGGFGKGKKKDETEKGPEPVTAKLAKGYKVVKGEFDLENKGFKAGEALEKGLENEVFSPKKDEDKKGFGGFQFFQITIADENKGDVKKGEITQILVPDFGGFGGKGGLGKKAGGGKG